MGAGEGSLLPTPEGHGHFQGSLQTRKGLQALTGCLSMVSALPCTGLGFLTLTEFWALLSAELESWVPNLQFKLGM